MDHKILARIITSLINYSIYEANNIIVTIINKIINKKT